MTKLVNMLKLGILWRCVQSIFRTEMDEYYEEAYDDGRHEGYEVGYEAGYEQGYEDAREREYEYRMYGWR